MTSIPPVNQVPSLTLGRLIYWGLFNGLPFGRLDTQHDLSHTTDFGAVATVIFPFSGPDICLKAKEIPAGPRAPRG